MDPLEKNSVPKRFTPKNRTPYGWSIPVAIKNATDENRVHSDFPTKNCQWKYSSKEDSQRPRRSDTPLLTYGHRKYGEHMYRMVAKMVVESIYIRGKKHRNTSPNQTRSHFAYSPRS